MATIVFSPSTLPANSIPENAGCIVVGTLGIEDAGDEEFAFSLDDPNFEIADTDNDGVHEVVVKEQAAFDFETGPRQISLTVRAVSTNGASQAELPLLIDIANVNEAPTDIGVSGGSVADTADLGALVATLQGEDPEGDALTYQFVTDGTGATALSHAFFEIVGDRILVKGELEVGTHSLWVKVTDAGTPPLSLVKQVTLTVTAGNEAPSVTFDMADVVEGAQGGAVVGSLSVSDPDEGDVVTYSLIEIVDGIGRPSTMFRLDDDGNVVVRDGVTLVRVNGADPTFTVKVTDGTNTIYETYDVLLGENQEPTIQFDGEVDLPRTIAGGTFVGTLVVDDPENGAITFTLVDGSEALFRIDQDGKVYVRDDVTLDFGTLAHHSFRVTLSDGFHTYTESFDLHFEDPVENQAPDLTLASRFVLEGAQAGAVVGTISATDPEGDALTYKLIGPAASLFTLVANGSGGYNIVVRAGVSLDYENDAHHSVQVEVFDGVNTVADFLELDLMDVDEDPVVTFTPVRVNEGAGAGTVVGRLMAIDPEGSDVSYELSSAGATIFDLRENNQGGYDIVVRQGMRLDYENAGHRTLRVTVSDGTKDLSKILALDLVDQVDIVTGTSRNDLLKGGNGSDIIKGLAGNDRLTGGAGDDWLYGGPGRDTLTGNAGKDVFVFDTKPNKKSNFDVVMDFDVKDDTIWLDNKVFTKLGKKGTMDNPAALNKAFVKVGSKAKDKNDYLIYNKKTGILSYDVDGSGAKAAVDVALLKKGLALTYRDFFVI